ncbi:XisH protein [Microcystis aeruginosa NIES-3806]|jgi:hypothetical protein|uniref:FdxN element excision controlling factor protein n=1 Tax=Microcystis aeruginosa PCC 9701 TaxID=721123 RepID=I4IN74_MICAE|nr:element excision factor XisH family protein [Microcystis aeruginosa]GCL55912.1 XisH protein [Microcystis aeruginosa NIES-3806]CCI35748.1 FdxN element excision controlling factor protein [Microcystis aeruginosa PCC 9701]
MPRYDLYHNQVKQALIKEGWQITDDPFTLDYKGIRLYADLGAERIFAAQKDLEKIVVEIKVFNSPSLMTELEKAIGQYNVYRSFLKRLEPQRRLYLAIPDDVYQDFFSLEPIQEVISDQLVFLIVFNPELEVINQWIK